METLQTIGHYEIVTSTIFPVMMKTPQILIKLKKIYQI